MATSSWSVHRRPPENSSFSPRLRCQTMHNIYNNTRRCSLKIKMMLFGRTDPTQARQCNGCVQMKVSVIQFLLPSLWLAAHLILPSFITAGLDCGSAFKIRLDVNNSNRFFFSTSVYISFVVRLFRFCKPELGHVVVFLRFFNYGLWLRMEKKSAVGKKV